MWPLGELLAAEAPANDSLVVVVGGIVIAAIGALGLVLTEIVKGRAGRTTPAPPGTVQPQAPVNVELYERTAVLGRRADDNDERDDLQDRRLEVSEDRHDHADDRLERIERYLTTRDPDWRP